MIIITQVKGISSQLKIHFKTMANLDLTKYGITGSTVIAHNPSYEQLFEEETKAGLEGFEVGQVTELGAVNVMTGIFTGRSPKDKYIVDDAQRRQGQAPCLFSCGIRNEAVRT